MTNPIVMTVYGISINQAQIDTLRLFIENSGMSWHSYQLAGMFESMGIPKVIHKDTDSRTTYRYPSKEAARRFCANEKAFGRLKLGRFSRKWSVPSLNVLA